MDGNDGHRKRLTNFLIDNYNTIPKYQLLECLLTFAIPRKDTKNIAKNLLLKFQTLNNILTAPKETLLEIEFIGENTVGFLKCIYKLCLYIIEEKIEKNNSMELNTTEVAQYARMKIGHSNRENFIAFLFSLKKEFIKEYYHSKGTLSYNPIYLREFVREILETKTAYVIISHNHPSGNHRASVADIELTNKIYDLLGELDIVLYDHIIVSSNGFFSLKDEGIF